MGSVMADVCSRAGNAAQLADGIHCHSIPCSIPYSTLTPSPWAPHYQEMKASNTPSTQKVYSIKLGNHI